MPHLHYQRVPGSSCSADEAKDGLHLGNDAGALKAVGSCMGRKRRHQRERLIALGQRRAAVSKGAEILGTERRHHGVVTRGGEHERGRPTTLPGLRPHTAEDQEPVIVKSGGGSSFSPLATIRRHSSGKGRCNFSASGVSPSSQRSTSSGVVKRRSTLQSVTARASCK